MEGQTTYSVRKAPFNGRQIVKQIYGKEVGAMFIHHDDYQETVMELENEPAEGKPEKMQEALAALYAYVEKQ